jgi:UDP-N-acetylmuramate: L-alanyl-gamma-D-glutamyl-meso-diaminopimelate ligase
MRGGEHKASLAAATADADLVYWYQPPAMDGSLDVVLAASPVTASLETDIDVLARRIAKETSPGDRVVIMSNGSFGGIHQKVLAQLEATKN